MENESVVLTRQNVDLRCDLARIAEEITQQRRESTAEIQSLVTKLALKDDEVLFIVIIFLMLLNIFMYVCVHIIFIFLNIPLKYYTKTTLCTNILTLVVL